MGCIAWRFISFKFEEEEDGNVPECGVERREAPTGRGRATEGADQDCEVIGIMCRENAEWVVQRREGVAAEGGRKK